MQVVDLFIDSLKSVHTKDKYSYQWVRFLRYLPEAKELKVPERLTESIISYLVSMKDQGLSHSYRSVALAAIKHFYSMHDILLNWKKISKFLGENNDIDSSKGYSREQIASLVSVADIKYKAVILLYASTGMRREALVQLKISDMEYLNKHQIYKINIYRKSKSAQICYCSPEAAEAVQLYLKSKELGPNDKLHDVEPKAVSSHLRELAIRAGITSHHSLVKNKEKRGQFRDMVPATHGLRKFCITQMALAKVDTEVAKLLTGHSIGVRAKYLNYTDQDLLQEYSKAIPLLTVSEEEKFKVANEQLAVRNKQFVESVDSRLREKDEEVSRLKEQIAAIQKEQHEGKQYFKEALEKLTKEPVDIKLFDGNDVKYTKYSSKESKEIDKLVKGVGKQVSNKIVKSKAMRR